jgi:hypothetical protein
MKWLPSGLVGNRIVNWEGVRRERVREFSPRNRPRPGEGRSRRVPRRSRAVRRPGRARRKPLRFLAETKEPRDLSAAEFFVNCWVRQFRT